MKTLEEIKDLIIQLESKINELKSDLLQDEILIQEEIKSIYKISVDDNSDYLKFKDYRFQCLKNTSKVNSLDKGIAFDLKFNDIISIKLKKLKDEVNINGIEINSSVIDVTRKI